MTVEPEWTVEKALNFALSLERESILLYTSAQEKAIHPASKQMLADLVKEEERHQTILLELKKNPDVVTEIEPLETQIVDLKIVDFLEDVSLSPDADYQQILIFAGKREKTAHDLYIWMAQYFQNREVGKLFVRLAQEELKHKYLLETEYDDTILKQM